MPATVVYIHGNGNKAREESLKDQWDRSLFGENVGDRSRMAYWASLRYPAPLPDVVFDEVEHGEISPEGLEGLAAEPQGLDPGSLAAEARLKAAKAAADGPDAGGLEGVAPPEEETPGLDAWLERMAYAADATVAGEELDSARDRAEALPLPRSARIAIFRALVKVTFKDVYAYFFGNFREPMREVLRKELRAAPDPVVVVSHSLGTIIAYDVLRESAFARRQVPLFVTAGSPLGTTELQDLVVRPLEVPAGVAAWRNVADARDLVALDRTLRPEYRPEGRCTDFLVTNESDNHHGIRQYLATRPVRDAVRVLL
jgi:hypothetical protein